LQQNRTAAELCPHTPNQKREPFALHKSGKKMEKRWRSKSVCQERAQQQSLLAAQMAVAAFARAFEVTQVKPSLCLFMSGHT